MQFRRLRITFDNSGQSTDLNNLPVLVRLDGALLNYADARPGGQDVRFIDADGVTVLPHEIERWDPAGTSILWVRVPRVDAGSATDFIWMYYGQPAAPDAQSPASVWSPDYVGVWHLGGALTDSTSYGHHGTNNGSTGMPDAFADARHFDGASWVHIAHTSTLALTGALTIEAWAKIDDPDLFSAMRVIDKKPRIVFLCHAGERAQRRDVAVHGEDAVGRNHCARMLGAMLFEQFPRGRRVAVRKGQHLGAAHARAGPKTSVIQLVYQDQIVRVD